MPEQPSSHATELDGALEERDGRYVLRFERALHHPVERVWEAITKPERIVEWFGEGKVELELVEGGRLDVQTTGPPELVEAIIAEAGEDALISHDTVLRVEPPSLFEHTFGGAPDSIVRWELQRDGEGCRLFLTHTEPGAFSPTDSPRDLAGWHTLLDQLARALGGAPVTWPKERWEALRARYAEMLR
jgi:uncharacterized protein YndB with AHSA1/START domain